jgi:hypothetical protein
LFTKFDLKGDWESNVCCIAVSCTVTRSMHVTNKKFWTPLAANSSMWVPCSQPSFYLYTIMVHASYFIHGHLQFIMPTVHVLVVLQCPTAFTCTAWGCYLKGQEVRRGTYYMINCIRVYLPMGPQNCYGKGQQLLFWAGSQATWRKITLSGIPNHLNYCVIFIVHTSFTNVATGHIIQPGWLWIGDPCIYQICMANIWPVIQHKPTKCTIL